MKNIIIVIILISVLVPTLVLSQEVEPPEQEYQLYIDAHQLIKSLDQAELTVENNVTIEAWIRFDDYGSFARLILGKAFDEFGHDWDYLFRTNDVLGIIDFRLSGGPGMNSIGVSSSHSVSIGDWAHIAGTYDGEYIKIFVNGQLSGSGLGETSQLDRGSPFMIGTAHPDGFRGPVRQVRLWNRALSEAEIAVSAQNMPVADASGLLGHWPLDDGIGQTARNLVGDADLVMGVQGALHEGDGVEPNWLLTDPFYEIREDLAFDIPTEEFGNSIPSFPAIADVNGDGLDDIVLSSAIGIGEAVYPIRVLLNDGNGAFFDGADEKFSGSVPKAFAAFQILIEDFNGDGFVDFYGGNAGTDNPEQFGERDFYYLADENGLWVDSFQSHIRSRPCTENSPSFSGQNPCASTPDGGFLYPETSGWTEPLFSLNGVASGDIDNDGDLDLLVAASSDGTLEFYDFDVNRAQPYFLINDGSGNLEADWERIPAEMIHSKSNGTNFNELRFTDLDQDGHLDLLVLGRGDTGFCCDDRHYEDGESYVFWNPGNGDFSNSQPLQLPQVEAFDKADNRPLIMDFDNDGDDDIILYRTDSQYIGRYIQFLTNQGNREFIDETSTRFPIQSGEGFALGHLRQLDLNEDGCNDLLNGGQIAWISGVEFNPDIFWLNDCMGNFKRVDSIIFSKPVHLFPVDIHGDGDQDFVTYKWGPVFVDFSVLESVRPFDGFINPPIGLINAGLNDAWVNAKAANQGMFVTVFPSFDLIFAAWFTFDSVAPPDGATATLGAPDQRWITALGPYSGSTATLNAELTTGGVFNTSSPTPSQDTAYGTITMDFDHCNAVNVEFDFPSAGESGSMVMTRAVGSNVGLCEDILAGNVVPTSLSTAGHAQQLSEPAKGSKPEASPAVFAINAGLNDSWANPNASFQGMFLTVLPDLDLMFAAWFTFDAQPSSNTATLGGPNQRWLTALGSFSGTSANLKVENTTGGLFNTLNPMPTQNTSYGTLDIDFSDCNNATVTFNIPPAGQSGSFSMSRVLDDNVGLCQALSAQ